MVCMLHQISTEIRTDETTTAQLAITLYDGLNCMTLL